MDATGGHYSKQINLETENQRPHVLTYKWRLNTEYTWTKNGNNRHWEPLEGGGMEGDKSWKTPYWVLYSLSVWQYHLYSKPQWCAIYPCNKPVHIPCEPEIKVAFFFFSPKKKYLRMWLLGDSIAADVINWDEVTGVMRPNLVWVIPL